MHFLARAGYQVALELALWATKAISMRIRSLASAAVISGNYRHFTTSGRKESGNLILNFGKVASWRKSSFQKGKVGIKGDEMR